MEPTRPLPIMEYRRFESFREYEELINVWIPRTELVIRVFDKTLSTAWNGAARDALLREYLLRDRINKLMIVVHDASNIERELPRLAVLARDFSHAVQIRQTLRIAQHVYDPFVLFDASHYVHRFHYRHMRAAQGIHDVEGAQLLIDRHAEIWNASAPAVGVTTSGL